MDNTRELIAKCNYLSKSSEEKIKYNLSYALPFTFKEKIIIINSHVSRYQRDWKSFTLAVILIDIMLISVFGMCLLLFFYCNRSYSVNFKGNVFILREKTVVVIKLIIIIFQFIIEYGIIYKIMRWRYASNKKELDEKERQYFEELLNLLLVLGIQSYSPYSVMNSLNSLEQFVSAIDSQLNVFEKKDAENKKATFENRKWLTALCAATISPIISTNFTYVKYFLKLYFPAMLLVMLCIIYFYSTYRLALKPLVLLFSFEEKIKNIRPIMHKLSFKTQHNDIQYSRHEQTDNNNGKK
ncbi:hypothetical protein [Leuconostoc citreum]|uniref:hypothetical protein n=1 Tax=Leuconostoc citreum TaxID=33964 RepID=UPI0032DF0987